jgi:hypothetical protein
MFGIDDAIAAVSKLADDVVTRIWPDATEIEKAKINQVAAEMQAQTNLVLEQLKINEVEATSPHWFVAAWRPAVGWVGVLTLLYSGIGISLATYVGAFWGIPPLPMIDPTVATNILYGLLGIGGMRTAEKIKDVATKKIGK